MKAAIGDELIVKGRHQGDGDRHGQIIEIHGEQGSPPYVVHWQDGHESVFFPSADTVVSQSKRRAARK
jgi:ribosomal protein S4E